MSKYKVGDKVILTVTGMTEMGGYPYYMLNDNYNLWEQSIDNHAEPLSTYTEPLEAKIHRQAAEITRLLAENKELKEDKAVLNAKIDAYKLYGDQHEEEYNQTFNQGAEAAWELVRKIFDMETNDIEDIFITEDAWNLGTVLNNYTYAEAAAKVEAWEKAKEIKVGDVVRLQEGSDNDLCILCKTSDEKYYNAVDKYGALYPLLRKGHFSKTGRHIDVDGFLKQIGGE